jgi:hypothetical protein
MSDAVERVWTVDAERLEATIAAARVWKSDGLRIEVAEWAERTQAPADDEGWRVLLEVTSAEVVSISPLVAARDASGLAVRVATGSRWTAVEGITRVHAPGSVALEVDGQALWLLVDGEARLGRVRVEATNVVGIEARSTVTNLNLRWCKQLTDLTPLAALTQLTSLDLTLCHRLTDLAPLAGLTQLKSLDLHGLLELTDLAPLASHSQLKSLYLSKCNRLIDLAPLAGLTELTSLSLRSCEQLADLAPLARLTQLTWLDLEDCRRLTHLAPLATLTQLTNLDLSNCWRLTNLWGLATLSKLPSLNLSNCKQLTDLAPLAGLTQLTSLNLGRCEQLTDLAPLAGLTQLTSLKLYYCKQLTDLTPLAGLTQLTNLDLSDCKQLTDLAPLAGLTQLTILNLHDCYELTDLAPLAGLTQLTSLNLCGCRQLTDLAPFASLTQLIDLSLGGDYLARGQLTDLAPLAGLTQLASLTLSQCDQLTDLAPLAGLTQLTNLTLSRCHQLTDLAPLAGLKALAKLVLEDCPELTTETWWPLETLPALRELKGSFPKWFLARTLSSAAADRDDAALIAAHLSDWLDAARSSPTRERLLSAVGAAAALLEPDVAVPVLVDLLTLSALHDAPDVEGLFLAIAPHAEQAAVAETLDRLAAQEEAPLPPETLAAIAMHGPRNPALRNATLLALARGLARDAVAAEWSARTARVVRFDLDDTARYPLTPSVHDTAFEALASRDEAARLDDVGLPLFGSLASDHAFGLDTAWRDAFHARLLEVALVEKDGARRITALSDLACGVARSTDVAWSRARLDDLLRRAAELDPDTSPIRAALAKAHALAERWQDAEDCAFTIARDPERDACLKDVATLVLASQAVDRIARALSLLGGIEAPGLRRERLRDLARDPALLADDTAYGELLALLADAPEVLEEVTADAIAMKPALAGVFVPDAVGPVTARERALDAAAQRTIERICAQFPEVGPWLAKQASRPPKEDAT